MLSVLTAKIVSQRLQGNFGGYWICLPLDFGDGVMGMLVCYKEKWKRINNKSVKKEEEKEDSGNYLGKIFLW